MTPPTPSPPPSSHFFASTPSENTPIFAKNSASPLFGTPFFCDTPLPTPLFLIATHTHLLQIAFPNDPIPPHIPQTNPLLQQAQSQLLEYFTHKRTTFSIPYALHASPFRIDIWKALARIPYAQTQSYQEIACAAGHPSATRATGSAIGANPLPILLPCHRVLPASGALGGFRAGPTWKAFLLAHEGLRR